MGNLTESFTNHKLSELIDLKYGKGLPQKKRVKGEYPVYGSGGIIGTHNQPLIKGPGIIVGRKGSVGTVFYEPSDFYPIDTVFYVIAKCIEIDLYYLSKLLTQLGLQNMNSDAAVPGLKREVALNQEVMIPPFVVQRKIAAILFSYEKLIENNLRRIKTLEEMAQNLYREWFVNFRFPGYGNTRLVDSPVGQIPEGWEVVKVGDVLKKMKRLPKVPKGNYVMKGLFPVIDQGKDFIGGYTDDEDTIISDDLPVIIFGDHTRVLKYIDFPFARGADGTQVLKSKSERLPMSLFYYALSEIDLSNYAYARHFKFLKDELILLPDEKSALLFKKFIDPNINHKKALSKTNINLRQTRDLLLPKLISGEVDVSELDINVPKVEAV